MKKKFYKNWKKSEQKRKQRKYRFNAPLNIKRKFLSANLSKELRKKYSKRSFSLRKGDTVKVLSGKFKNRTGKIVGFNKKLRVLVDGIQRIKRDGTKINLPLYPSKLQIIELNLDDKERMAALGRGKKIEGGKK
ncbi:50S ribosomal protein L24 [Candidatus Pacearchaeota archaeon]|nr:50S ribosomal protein L24 [Candidatus Pacearchaeota archaeon]